MCKFIHWILNFYKSIQDPYIEMFRQGDNENKLNYVIDKIISITIPKPLSLFITRDSLKSFVQSVFDETKKALDYVPRKEN